MRRRSDPVDQFGRLFAATRADSHPPAAAGTAPVPAEPAGADQLLAAFMALTETEQLAEIGGSRPDTLCKLRKAYFRWGLVHNAGPVDARVLEALLAGCHPEL